MPSSLKNSNGNAMLVVIISISVVITGVYAVSEYMSRLYRQEHTMHTKRRIAVLQQSIQSLIRTKVSWDATLTASVNAGVGFGCITAGGCSVSATEFSFFQSALVRLSDPSNPSAGMNLSGEPCTTFSLTNPDANCPVRYDFKWIVDCSSCYIKAPRILAELKVSHPDNFPLNTTNLKIDIVRGREAGSVGETCASMKGVFDAITGKCNLPFAGVECRTASSMDGTLPNGEVHCRNSPAFGMVTCNGNKKPVGMGPKGDLLCDNR